MLQSSSELYAYENASRWPSDDQWGWVSVPGGSWPSGKKRRSSSSKSSRSPLSDHKVVPVLLPAEKTILAPSGDHDGLTLQFAQDVRRTTFEPFAFIT